MYSTIDHSKTYYALHGFTGINKPWTVESYVSGIMKPEDKKDITFADEVLDGKLTPGRYFTVTPCFRDDQKGDPHQPYFIKTELIDILKDPNPDKETIEKHLFYMVKTCMLFFLQYGMDCIVVKTGDNMCKIVTFSNRVELGSYGVRKSKSMIWIYGTGCAEPCLSGQLRKTPGYHLDTIPRGERGTLEKVIEEYHEMIDAAKQNNKIMELIEISDLYGALEAYCHSKFAMSMDDIRKMSDATRRAFENNVRK